MPLDVLVVDDESDIRSLVSDILTDEGYAPRTAKDSVTALEQIENRLPAAMILDIWLQESPLDGLGILERVKQKHPNLPVIMISGHGNIEMAINSIKLGAYDFIEKPFKEDKLLHLLERAIETSRLKNENEELKKRGTRESELIGVSPAITQLKSTLAKVANTSSRIFIYGPAGCGKEVVARRIHQLSSRAKQPFILLNAASISQSRVEEELFGKEEPHGKSKIGTFEQAHGGTLFIDEVTDMPRSAQSRLLKFLQEDSFQRVNGDRKVKADVRVIAATNKDVHKEIKNGKFREDLFYRLNVVPITLPALKDRKEDIPALTQYFIQRCADLLGVPPREIDEKTIAAMQLYQWPGNVRQLRNVIEWLLIMAPEDENQSIDSSMLPPEVLSSRVTKANTDNVIDIHALNVTLKKAREQFEKQYIQAQLARFNGNVSQTAEAIGMERSALHRKLKTLNIAT